MPDQPRYADDWEYALAALRPDGQGWEVDPDRPASRPGETCWRRPLIIRPAARRCPVDSCPWDSRGIIAGAGEPLCAPTFTFVASTGCLLGTRAAEARTLRAEIAERRTDAAFAARLPERVNQDKPILDRLTGPEWLIADALSAVAFSQDHSTTRLTTEQIVRIALGTLDPPEPGDFAELIARIRRDHVLQDEDLVNEPACIAGDCQHRFGGECPTAKYPVCDTCEGPAMANGDRVNTGPCDALLAAGALERLAAAGGTPYTRQDFLERVAELAPRPPRESDATTTPMSVTAVETALRNRATTVIEEPWVRDLMRRAADLLHQADHDRTRLGRRLSASEWKRGRLIDYLRSRNAPAIIELRAGLESWRDRCLQAEEKALALGSAAAGLDGHAQWAAGERERADLRHQVAQLTDRLAISSANNRTQRTKRQDVQRNARDSKAQLVAVRYWITQHKCCSNPQACGGACMDGPETYNRAAVARELTDLLEATTGAPTT